MSSSDRFVAEIGEAKGRLVNLLLILWHGAGGDIDEPSLRMTAERFAAEGAIAVRARFGYRRAGRRVPDRMPALIADARETIAEVTAKWRRRELILGGRSMGGRVASMAVAAGQPADGLLFLSYPLHPEKRPGELRDAHLPQIRCPMLFVSGDRDRLAQLELLRPVIDRLAPRAELELFLGAGHTLEKKADLERAADRAVEWAARTLTPGSHPGRA